MTRKCFVCLFLALAMLVCAACGTLSAQTADITPAPVAQTGTASGADTVIAEIGSTRTVTYGELQDYYDYYVEMMSYYGSSAPTDEAEIEELQDMLLSDLVNQAKLLYFAEQLGMTELTAGEQAEVEAQAHEEIESYMEEFRAQAEEEGAADVEARAREIFNQDLIDYGIDMDVDAYEAYITTLYAEDKYLEKLENHVRETAVATDEDGKALYEQLVSEQTSEYAENPSLYGSDTEYFEKYGGTPAVVVPEGYVRVKVIAILPDGEQDASYTEKTEQMAEYEAEYGKLSLSDAAANATRLKNIETLYAALKLETDLMREEYYAAPRAKAETAYAALQGGMSFDEALSIYGEDADYVNYPALAENGRPLYLGGDDADDTVLANAAKALKPGEYSGIIETDSAFYILFLVKEETAGTRAYDDVRDAVMTAAASDKGDTAWDDQQAAWEADDSMVKTYPERYRSLGK